MPTLSSAFSGALRWVNLTPDEGPEQGGPHAPYRQSERLPIYQAHAEQLIAAGHAYPCFCTPERLAAMRKEQEARKQPPRYDRHCLALPPSEVQARLAADERHVVRMRMPDDGVTVFHDVVRGDISFENRLLDDGVLLKSDGFPTYHLAVVVDDHLMGITDVMRGEEWISSTPKHILLYRYFGWEPPTYAHTPLLLNDDRSKISKRKSPDKTRLEGFRERGFLPEALLNFLALLGWSHPDGQELFSLDEFVRVFSPDRLLKARLGVRHEQTDLDERPVHSALISGRVGGPADPLHHAHVRRGAARAAGAARPAAPPERVRRSSGHFFHRAEL